MARGTTLSNLVTMLKAELGDSLSAGTQSDAVYKKLLESKQKFLVTEFVFPFLEDRWDSSVVAGSRFLNFPTANIQSVTVAIDHEQTLKAEVKYNDLWRPMEYGIGSDEYNTFDSDADERSDPIQRWRYQGTQFEVWPRPTTAQTVRFTGQRVLSALTDNDHTADLDDVLLVLSVAVPLMLKSKNPAVSQKASEANRRLLRLLAKYSTRDEQVILGQRQSGDRREIRQAKLVLVT
jgi:hypothetical protein